MATDREAQMEALLRRYRAHLEQALPEGPVDIHQIEELAERVGQDVQRDLTERLVREEVAREEGNQTACPCGGRARFRGRYAHDLVTAAGRIRVRRAYYHCAACGQGHCPADARLGLGPAHTTPTAQARLAVLAALVPYTQVNDVLAQLGLPLALDRKSTERVAQHVGAQVQAAPPRLDARATRSVALALDGVMLPTWAGAKETRCAVVYEPDWDAGRTPVAEAGLRKEYFATTGSRESLVRAACARAVARCGPEGTLAVLGDAAALDWVDLRPLLEAHVAAWVEILDFYHVTERLGTIATAMFPGDPARGTAWRGKQQRELLTIGPWELLRELEAWTPTSAAGQEVRREQRGYFAGQQHRMRYPDYLRRGFPIGSGAVEGACKHVVSDRFKGSGMRWKLPTAEPLLHLRAALLTHPRLDLRRYTGSPTAIAPA
jgi:transposase